MEPAQAKPIKRRRRRWLIVALLLVLASGVAWWEWPRGDSRFVGKWTAFANGNFDTPSAIYVFGKRHVQIQHQEDAQYPAISETFRWRSQDETLELESGVPQFLDACARSAIQWIWIRTGWLTPHRLVVHGFRFGEDGNSVVLRQKGELDMLLIRTTE